MAKAKVLPKGVLNSRQMLSKISKESDSLGLVLLYGTENYMIDGAVGADEDGLTLRRVDMNAYPTARKVVLSVNMNF